MQGTSTTEAKSVVGMCHINHLNDPPPGSTPSQFFGHLWSLFRESDLVQRVSSHDIVEPGIVPNHNTGNGSHRLALAKLRSLKEFQIKLY